MKKIFFNLVSKIIPLKRDIKPFSYTPKDEQHPQKVKIFSTIVPDGKSMDDWIKGDWATFHSDKDKEK